MLRFSNRRQEEIYIRLQNDVGEGPAAMFQDVCVLFREPTSVPLHTASHLAAHLMRDIHSAVGSVFVPLDFVRPKDGGDKATLEAILGALDSPIAELWPKLSDLHKMAHRRGLDRPRPIKELSETWETFQKMQLALLLELDGAWPQVFRKIDEILAGRRFTIVCILPAVFGRTTLAAASSLSSF